MPCHVENATIDQFCEKLGVEKIDNGSHWLVEFAHNNHKCNVTQKGDKLIFSVQKPHPGEANRGKSDAIWSELTTSINCNASRKIDDIVRDFERRISWEGLTLGYIPCFLGESASHQEHLDETFKLAVELSLASDHKAKKIREDRYIIDPVGPWHSIAGSMVIEGNYIQIDIRGLKNVEMAKEIAAVLRKYKKTN
jgi:hypothetical protein